MFIDSVSYHKVINMTQIYEQRKHSVSSQASMIAIPRSKHEHNHFGINQIQNLNQPQNANSNCLGSWRMAATGVKNSEKRDNAESERKESHPKERPRDVRVADEHPAHRLLVLIDQLLREDNGTAPSEYQWKLEMKRTGRGEGLRR